MSIHYKVALFDADGVTITPPRPYSYQHAETHRLDVKKFEAFFGGDFQLALRGKADLKELIMKHASLWKPNGDPQYILNAWFEAENFPNHPLLGFIQQLRSQDTKCFLASDQEKYRAEYLKRSMFSDEFDGMFLSCDIGVTKRDPTFFPSVMARLSAKIPKLQPRHIIYFDDNETNVFNAKKAGIDAWVYQDVDQVRTFC